MTNETDFTPNPSEQPERAESSSVNGEPIAESGMPQVGTDAVVDEAAARRIMRRQYTRLGLALVVMLAVWMLLMQVIYGVASYLTNQGVTAAAEFYNHYMLLFNEATLALGILGGWLALRGAPKMKPEKRPFSAGHFITLFFICVAVSIAGNIISLILLGIWNAVTGNSAGNDLAQTMATTSPVLMFLAVGILAPILEELFFRKLVIDHTRQYGEMTCMMTSAVLFALFHQNFSQLFYAFGAGLLLAYLYCRSGKLWLTMLLHALFNCFSGVISFVLAKKVLEFSTIASGMTEEALWEALPQLMREYLVPLLLYILYLFAMFGMAIAGLVLFILRVRRFRAEPGVVQISAKARRRAIFSSVGMIIAVLVLLALSVTSLFL